MDDADVTRNNFKPNYYNRNETYIINVDWRREHRDYFSKQIFGHISVFALFLN